MKILNFIDMVFFYDIMSHDFSIVTGCNVALPIVYGSHNVSTDVKPILFGIYYLREQFSNN